MLALDLCPQIVPPRMDGLSFEQADIHLDQRIFLEAKELTAKEVFDKMFLPQNIAYKVDGKTVQLTPASR